MQVIVARAREEQLIVTILKKLINIEYFRRRINFNS